MKEITFQHKEVESMETVVKKCEVIGNKVEINQLERGEYMIHKTQARGKYRL